MRKKPIEVLETLSSPEELEKSVSRLSGRFRVDKEIAQEVAAASRAVVLERLSDGKTIYNVGGYLRTTEDHKMLAELRRRGQFREEDLACVETRDIATDIAACRREEIAIARLLVNKLRTHEQQKYYELYKLRFVESLTFNEIARRWKVSEPSVYTMLTRMLGLLAKWADEDGRHRQLGLRPPAGTGDASSHYTPKRLGSASSTTGEAGSFGITSPR